MTAIQLDTSATQLDAPRGLVAWQDRPAVAYPVLLALAVALVMPTYLGHPLLHDSFAINWVWADQFTAELARGNFYPRWLPLSNGGLGAPVFYYYPPLAFHVAGIFGLLGLSTYESVIATFAAGFALSGITCWHWQRGRSNHPLLGAAFFAAAPYHLFDYVVRGALAESFAIAFIPLIAIGLRRIAERRGGIVFTAIAYGGIICTHLPLALLVSVLLISPYALVHRAQMRSFAIGVSFGIALAAIYLVPAFALEPFRDVNQLFRSANLRPAYWNITASNWDNGVFLAVFAIVAALALAAALPAWRGDRWAIYAITVCVLVTGLVPFFWSLPLLEKVQFPYRALPIAEFGLAFALARLPSKSLVVAAALPLALSALLLPGFNLGGSDMRRLREMHPDVAEYLPPNVIPQGKTDTKLEDVLTPRIPSPLVSGMVVKPVFYFPAWSCGQPEPRTQLLMHEPGCRPELRWTNPEKTGAIITLIAALALLVYSLANRSGPPNVALSSWKKAQNIWV